MSVTVAIIGSGPSGFYAAEGLFKFLPGCSIDLIDRLPTPFGLVRAGVAPDHLGTKNVINQYEKTFEKGDLRYFGNIQVGRDVSIAELEEIYDIVVIACGAAKDRALGIPGEDLPGVYGSAAFVGWYNGHPDHVQLDPKLDGCAVAVIGNGNVSLDISRLLVKTSEELAESDLWQGAVERLTQAKTPRVHLVGRRGPVNTSFTPPELRELGKLDAAVPVIDATLLPDELPEDMDTGTPAGRVLKKDLEIFRSFTEIEAEDGKARVHLDFLASPVEILGEDRVRGIRMERNRMEDGRAIGTGEFFDLEVGVVITAIGYRSVPIEGVPFDEARGIYANTDGKIRDNLYVVGWGKRGPSGTIPTNRPDSFAVAKLIAETAPMGGKDSRSELETLLGTRNALITDYSDWKQIDAVETGRATAPKPREKVTTVPEMLDIIQS